MKYEVDKDIFRDSSSEIGFKIKEDTVDIYYKNKRISTIFLNGKGRVKSQKETNYAIQSMMEHNDNFTKKYYENLMRDLNVKLISAREVKEKEKEEIKEDFGQILTNEPSSAVILQELGERMKKKYNIIKTKEGNYFYLDGYMRPLTKDKYGYLVEKEFNVSLALRYTNQSLESIHGDEKENKYLWEFNQHKYLDMRDYEIKELDPQITSRKFILNEELLNYNPYIEYYNEDATAIEKALRNILVPVVPTSRNPHALLKNFLYFIGEALISGNPSKNIIIFHNKEGNNGKTYLGKLLKMIFGQKLVVIQPKDLGDQFLNARIDDSNIILFDELLPNSLNTHWDTIKKISGGEIVDNIREMYTTDAKESEGYGMIFIMTNDLPEIPINDTALLYRTIIFELPNRFVSNPTAPNELPLNVKIGKILENDKDGLEWLINSAIKCYYENEKTFKRQSEKETKIILSQDNFIRNWLYNNTMQSDTNILSNKELVEFIYQDSEYESIFTRLEVGQRIGNELNSIYGNKLKRYQKRDGVAYNLTIV